MDENLESTVQNAWYACGGQEDDIVLSTKVELARNLANFLFPQCLRGTDCLRVREVVFDAFNHLENSEDFQAIAVNQLDMLGSRILQERGILKESPEQEAEKEAGIILRTDGVLACTVNILDHVRISSFVSGLDLDEAVRLSSDLDKQLQKRIQFAASYDFGYLTASIMEAGSGMKLSLRVHLPSLSMQGTIGSVSEELNKNGILFSALYGVGDKGASLGSYYELVSTNSQTGSEFDQVVSMSSAAKKLAEMERGAREKCLDIMPSEVRNYLYRSIALARSSIFISLREAVDIISGVKWGKDIGLVDGIDDATLHALLYRIQEGHLEYVLKNGEFHFEKDISDNPVRKNERLRALILQEAFEDVKIAL